LGEVGTLGFVKNFCPEMTSNVTENNCRASFLPPKIEEILLSLLLFHATQCGRSTYWQY